MPIFCYPVIVQLAKVSGHIVHRAKHFHHIGYSVRHSHNIHHSVALGTKIKLVCIAIGGFIVGGGGIILIQPPNIDIPPPIATETPPSGGYNENPLGEDVPGFNIGGYSPFSYIPIETINHTHKRKKYFEVLMTDDIPCDIIPPPNETIPIPPGTIVITPPTTPVSEPSMLMTFAIAVGLIIVLRRRKRSPPTS